MFILSQVLLLAGIAAITTSAAPATNASIPVLNETYIIVLREFQNYTGGPLPSTYNNSKTTVENFLRRYSSTYFRGIYYYFVERFRKLYPRYIFDIAKYLSWYYPVVGEYSPLYIGFVAELNARAFEQVSNFLFCFYLFYQDRLQNL